MYSYSKKILVVLLSLILVGCQSNSNHIEDSSDAVDTDSVEYYNSTKAPEWSVVEGIKMDAYVLQEDVEHRMQSDILQNDDTTTLSFWIEPTKNTPGSFLFTLINDKGDYIRMTNSGVADENSYHGLNLEMKVNGKSSWVTAHSDFSLNSHQYNHIAITFNNQQVEIYLNGLKAVDGALSNSVSDIKDGHLSIGKDAVGYVDNIEGKFQNFKIVDYTMSAEEIKQEFDQLYPQVLMELMTFPEMDDVTEDFWLWPELNDTYPVTWTSDKPEFIKPDRNFGVVTIPSLDQGDQEVTLTMTGIVNGLTFSKDFVFTVRAESLETDLYRDTFALDNDIDHIMNENEVLPTLGKNNSNISWEILEGNSTIENNKIIKTTNEEKMNVKLRATLSNGGNEKTLDFEVVLLDEYVGYIMSYFNGDLGEERGKYAYSYDGLNWTDLNGGQTTLSSNLGNGRIRDPFISRDENGDFIVLATQGFDNPEIYIWKSTDLIDFSYHALEQIAYYDESLISTGERAWAPEMIYDEKEDLYTIIYSDPLHDKGGHIYYVTTEDFTTFSYPGAFYAPGYPVIDGTVVNMDGKFWMFYKDERVGATTIFYASSNQLSNQFGLAYDQEFIFNKKFIEGPFVVDSIDSDNYYLYVDNYPNEKFYVARFSELGLEPNFEWLDESEYQLPNEDVRHGSTVAVTQKELDRILEIYK